MEKLNNDKYHTNLMPFSLSKKKKKKVNQGKKTTGWKCFFLDPLRKKSVIANGLATISVNSASRLHSTNIEQRI